MLSYRVGIWSRLLLAFSFIAGITVIVGILSLLIFNSSEQVVEELAEEYIPEIVQITGFVKIGGEIAAIAPNILSSEDEKSRAEVKGDLDRLLGSLREKLSELTIAQSELQTSVEKLVIRLETNLTALQFSVIERSELQGLLNKMMERLRWLYADLLGEIDPLRQDYAYNMDAEIERIIDAAKGHDSTISLTELQENRAAKESIEKIRSNGVLLVSLMMQSASLETSGQIESLSWLSEDTIAVLREDVSKLGNEVSAMTLRSVLEEIYNLAEGDESLFSLRSRIVENALNGRAILQDNQRYVEELDHVIEGVVTRAKEVSRTATESTRKTFTRAKTTLILMILLSMVTVAAVMWFYVRGNIVARLSALSRSMRAIARGELSYQVPAGGTDEIGRMAIALRTFRDTEQERRRIENELAQAGKLAALGQFSAGIAHELNQPLSAIRYYLHNADKLLERGQTEIHRDNLIKMEELVERMAKMINHLKTFTRFQPDSLCTVNIHESISRAIELLSDRLETGGVSVSLKQNDRSATVFADNARLEQVFVNVLSNAIDAAKENKQEPPEVVIGIGQQGNETVVSVSDNGHGINAEPTAMVFDPFYTTKEIGKGLGLGLSIAYNIVKGFGGTMTAENRENGGSCFTIILPNKEA